MTNQEKQKDTVQSKKASGNLNLIGENLGNYRITEQLGKGGMGVVYKAYDRALDRIVALKVLPLHLADDTAFIKRFIREARIAAKIEHSNIVPIYTANKSGNLWYIAMQYVKGKTLSDYQRSKYRFSIRDAFVITKSVAQALATSHRMGIIHRDIKPSNIMIDSEGKVKVMDFGLARAMINRNKITHTGVYLGTPEYSSPEQCESSAVDERADIYSLGVVLYELLSGRVPHVAETPLALFKKIVEEEPIPLKEFNPKIPAAVVNLVNKMMEKDKEKRFQSTKELLSAMDKILKTEKLSTKAGAGIIKLQESLEHKATPVTPVKRRRKPFVIKKQAPNTLYIAIGAAAVALIAMLFLFKNNAQENIKDKTPVNNAKYSASTAEVSDTVSLISDDVTTVVFDFKNLGENEDVKWLEVAISEMLIVNLNQCDAINAIPRHNVLNTMRKMGKRISLLSETGQINKESIKLLDSLESDLVISGSFFVPEPPKIRIMVSIDRYNEDTLDHILDCQIDGANYNKDLLKIIDQLTLRITDSLREKGQDHIADIDRITLASNPDISGLMVAQLDQADQMRNYLNNKPVTDGELLRGKNDFASGSVDKSVNEKYGRARSLESDAQPKKKKSAKALSKEKYSDDKIVEGNEPATPAPAGKPELEEKSETQRVVRKGKIKEQTKTLTESKKSDLENLDKKDNTPDLIQQLKRLYENIQQIEEQEFGGK